MYKRYFIRRIIAVAVAASMMLAVFGSSGKAVHAWESKAMPEPAINESLKLWYTEPRTLRLQKPVEVTGCSSLCH